MQKVKVLIYKEKSGFSLCAEGETPLPFALIGEGVTADDAIAMWLDMYRTYRADFESRGVKVADVEFSFVYDVPSVLSYYSFDLTNKGIGKRSGIATSMLSQYTSGFRNASAKTARKIEEALHQLGRELCQVQLTAVVNKKPHAH